MTAPTPRTVERNPRRLPSIRYWMVAALLAVSIFPAQALALSAVALPDSVKAVEQAPPTGVVNPHKPWITRRVLKAEEIAAPLEIEVALKMRNFTELQARVGRGERINAQEMAAKYEPLARDYDAVASWLTTQGLTITRTDDHRMAIFARGRIDQIQQALHVTFARVALEGTEYTSAISAPSVPAALSPLLVGINGLQPHVRPHRHFIKQQAHPDASSGSASYLPKQIAQAYNATGLYNANINGSGEAIAIVIDTFPTASDLETFWQDAGVSQTIGNIQFIQAVAGTLPSPSGEETLDVEWSSAMAPAAHVRVYAATDLANADLDQAYLQVYDDVTNHPELGIHQMSMSYGQGETYTTNSQVQTDDQYFSKLAAAGVTVFASSGDDGSTPGARGTGDESGSVQVETPASDPNVTGVGGTTLILDGNNNEISEGVWNANGGASGGGVSIYFNQPAWQTGTGVGSASGREVPDVAAPGDPDYGAEIVQGGVVQTVGGTSWSSPTWAGFCALLNQARADAGQSSIGLLGPHLYPLLGAPNYPSEYTANFRDITSGNNATRFSGGDYSATTGYDLCTGLGAPHVQTVAAMLTGSSALVAVQMPASVDEVVPGQDGTFTVGVSGTTATYHWQRMPVGTATWSNLSDNGTYNGSIAATLTIANTTKAMSGDQFQCLVTLGTNTITTAPTSVLIVDTPLGISTLAGQVATTGLANGGGTTAQFNYPSGLAVDSTGNIYIADYGNNQIRKVTAGGTVSTPYGNVNGQSGSTNAAGNSASFNGPNAIAVDGSNNLYVADTGNNLIRKITGGTVSTLAGTGGQFNSPEGVAVDATGNVYVADTNNDVIRKVTSGGAISILAGQDGVSGYADGAATTKALFNGPTGVAVDKLGNVYVADFNNDVVRKISAGTVTTVAGKAGDAGYLDGLGTNALLNAPLGLAVDSANNLYIADSQVPPIGSTAAGNCLIRRLTPAGVVSTIAGQAGVAGSANGTGAAAQFYSVQAVAEGSSGVFYLADTYNQTVRTGTDNGSIIVSSTSVISLSGNLAFGKVGINLTATNTLTISNTGNAVLTVTGIAYPTDFSGNWTSGTIQPGASQMVTVTFAPTAAIGYGGSIIVSSDATGGINTIATSGAGVIVPSAPTVTTSAATGVGASAATLNGEVNPEGASTTAYFEYGLTGTYGGVTAGTSGGVGTTNVPFTATISGLLPLTTYHYQAVASNTTGTVHGVDETFTTQSFTVISVAATGDAAAGITGAEFSTIGNPVINSNDYTAFEATLANGAGGVMATDNAGVWAQDSSGTRYLVARTGAVAPGAGSAVFMTLSNPVYNSSEAVAFLGKLKPAPGQATPSNATGIWSNSGGSLALVARQGGQAPGYPAGTAFASFNALALPDEGGVLFLAILNKGQHGIWAGNSATNLKSIVKPGDNVNGKTVTGITFLPTLPYVNGQTRSYVQGTGALVYHATFSDKTTGIVKVTGSNLQLLATTKDAAAGVTGGQFLGFGSPAINGTGNVAFQGTLANGTGGVTAADNSGIWANDDAGILQLVARTGSAAPGASAVFQTLGNPVYNDNQAVAFRATLKVATGGATPATAAGIWSNSGGPLTLVARQGSQAPGCSAGATFKTFNAIALPDQGGAVMLATLNNNSSANVMPASNVGIWAVDTSGNLDLIARKGQVLNGKTITGLSFLPIVSHVAGQSRNFNQRTGDLVYQVTFSDKTSALSAVVFP